MLDWPHAACTVHPDFKHKLSNAAKHILSEERLILVAEVPRVAIRLE